MNLAIGNTSQIFHYLKKHDPKLLGADSRNFLNDEFISLLIKTAEKPELKFERIFLCFSEQRTFLNETNEFYEKTNVDYTLAVINKIKNATKKIIVYSTSEVYNLHEHGVDSGSKFYNTETPYILSKELMVKHIKRLRSNENINIHIVTPFNFNSPYRGGGYLFSKF